MMVNKIISRRKERKKQQIIDSLVDLIFERNKQKEQFFIFYYCDGTPRMNHIIERRNLEPFCSIISITIGIKCCIRGNKLKGQWSCCGTKYLRPGTLGMRRARRRLQTIGCSVLYKHPYQKTRQLLLTATSAQLVSVRFLGEEATELLCIGNRLLLGIEKVSI